MQASFPVAPVRSRPWVLLASVVLAVGMLASSVVLGAFFYGAQRVQGEVRVVGAATVPFESDVVKWRVFLVRSVEEPAVAEGYAALRGDIEAVRTRLLAAGLPPGAIGVQPAGSQPVWGPQGQITGYQIRQGLVVVSPDLDAVEALALNPGDLMQGGVILENSQLEYFYDDLPELKRSLLARATDDARSRADEIAGRTEARLGRMTTARAGVFQITEPYSTEVSGYGMYNTATRSKEITVTVHATFELR